MHPADAAWLPGWLAAVPFAHRGLHGPAAPENSLAAVEAAAAVGLGVELDVRLAADGVPVVVHDADLKRVAGAPLVVAESTAAELGGVVLRGGDEPVPTLERALDAVGGRVPVMLELKARTRRAGPLAGAVAAAVGRYGGPVCVASFNPLVVGWFAARAPGVLRGQTAGRLEGLPLPAALCAGARRLWWDRVTRPHFVCFRLAALPAAATDAWRDRGRVLIAWTARTVGQLHAARRRADNVILEGPAAEAAVS